MGSVLIICELCKFFSKDICDNRIEYWMVNDFEETLHWVSPSTIWWNMQKLCFLTFFTNLFYFCLLPNINLLKSCQKFKLLVIRKFWEKLLAKIISILINQYFSKQRFYFFYNKFYHLWSCLINLPLEIFRTWLCKNFWNYLTFFEGIRNWSTIKGLWYSF